MRGELRDDAEVARRTHPHAERKPEVEADAYIDDGPHNVLALRELGNEVIVFDQPYNRDLPGPRAHDWAEVEEIVEELVAHRSAGLQRQLPGIDAGADRIERRRGGGA